MGGKNSSSRCYWSTPTRYPIGRKQLLFARSIGALRRRSNELHIFRGGKGGGAPAAAPPLPTLPSLSLPLLTFSDEGFVVTIGQRGYFVV